MKKLSLFFILMIGLLFSCNDDDNVSRGELTLSQTEVYLIPNETATVNIESWSGDLLIRNSNEKAIQTTLSDKVLSIKALDVNNDIDVVIYLIDSENNTKQLKVSIRKEYELNLDTKELTLYTNFEDRSTALIRVLTGNGNYRATILEDSNNCIALDTVGLSHYGKLSVRQRGTKGTAKIAVTDAKNFTKTIGVNIISATSVSVDNYDLSFNEIQDDLIIKATGGDGDFNVVFDNPKIAKATVNGSEITFTSMNNGVTNAYIIDGKLQKTEKISVKVSASLKAFDMSDDYFAYTSYTNLTPIMPSLKKLKQVTWEMNCKMHNYRGLQTFFGLEGQLVVRGINDDYRDTHPIQIAGLSDNIKLETRSSFVLNKWMHIALVVDCEQSEILEKYKLYIDGISQELIIDNGNETHLYIDMASSGDDNRFVIGRATTQDWRVIKGIVAEARVWTEARTQQQIIDNMCELIENNTNRLLSRWHFSSPKPTNYILDVNGSKYTSNMILANARNNYDQVEVSKDRFVEKECPIK